MKLSSIILSLILIVLSCLPCADGETDAAHDIDNEAIAQNHSNHSDEPHTDLCSPFCICNCCGAQILNFTPSLVFNIIELPVIYGNKLETTYKSQLASMFSGSIWQPPQIV